MSSSPFYFQQPFCQLATGCRVLEFDPPADLEPFVAKLIYVNIREGYIRQRVPDACFSLVIGVHEATGVARSFVGPPSLEWAHWPVQVGWTWVEARLRWGMGMHFLRCAPEELGRSWRPASDVIGKRWCKAVERVQEATSPQMRMTRFIEALRAISPNEAVLRPEIRRTVSLLEKRRPHLRVDDLADAACLSASQLRRVFSRETGASPKELLRLSRLWWSMRLALERRDVGWGSIAAEMGFSDQSHLVDEYRHFTGSPPKLWYANLFGVKPVEERAVSLIAR